jgi:hypothetical protein
LIGPTIAAIMLRPFPLSVLGSIKRVPCVSRGPTRITAVAPARRRSGGGFEAYLTRTVAISGSEVTRCAVLPP